MRRCEVYDGPSFLKEFIPQSETIPKILVLAQTSFTFVIESSIIPVYYSPHPGASDDLLDVMGPDC